MTKYSYFPGCNLKTNAKGFEETAIAVSKKLDVELVEMPEWNCCGTIHTQTKDNLMKRLAPVRDLARASEHAKELGTPDIVVTLCSMCNSTLRIVNAEPMEGVRGPSKVSTRASGALSWARAGEANGRA